MKKIPFKSDYINDKAVQVLYDLIYKYKKKRKSKKNAKHT